MATKDGAFKNDAKVIAGVDVANNQRPIASTLFNELEVNDSSVLAQLQTLNSFTPAQYDYIALSYTGSNLTQVQYKLGGSGGTIVSTLTLAYTGANLTSVTKS